MLVAFDPSKETKDVLVYSIISRRIDCREGDSVLRTLYGLFTQGDLISNSSVTS